MKKIVIFIVMVFSLLFVSSCGDKKIITNTYQVVFFTFRNDNSIQPIHDVEPNSKIEKPEEPSRDGFEFIKWATDQYGENEWDFENDVVTKSMTLFAIWIQGEFTITFELYGGTFPPTAVIPDSYLEDVTVYFPQPNRIGYEFVGWFLLPPEEVMEGQTGLFSTINLSGSIILYAKWKARGIKITFKSEIPGVQLPKPPIQIIQFDSIINFPDYTDLFEDYTFLGWFDALGNQYINGELFQKASEGTITAKFAPKE